MTHAEVCARLRAEIERCELLLYAAALYVLLEIAERHGAQTSKKHGPLCNICEDADGYSPWPCADFARVAAFAETLEPSK